MSTKTLNKDINLVLTNNNKYDLDFQIGESIIVTGLESLQNAILITVLTGYQELAKVENETYENFGNKSHKLLKANQNKTTEYKLQQYLKECLQKIRRIRSIDEISITTNGANYECYIRITSITDETITQTVVI